MPTEEEIRTAIDELCNDVSTIWSDLDVRTVESLKKELIDKFEDE